MRLLTIPVLLACLSGCERAPEEDASIVSREDHYARMSCEDLRKEHAFKAEELSFMENLQRTDKDWSDPVGELPMVRDEYQAVQTNLEARCSAPAP